MSPALIIFILLAVVAVACAVAMLVSKNAVYSALFLVLNFATIAVIYLMLGAPFIAVAQITVYAGAIMVLFLFVIMLLGGESLRLGEPIRGQRLMGLIFGVVLLAEIILLVVFRSGMDQVVAAPVVDSSPAALGMEMFSKYSLPFEVTSLILLVALIGAVILTRVDPIRRAVKPGDGKKEDSGRQA